MNLRSVTSIIKNKSFEKKNSMVYQNLFIFIDIQSGSSFGNERKPATLLLSVSQRSHVLSHWQKDAMCLQVLLSRGSVSD